MFNDALSLTLYAVSVLGAQIGIILLLVGRNKTQRMKRGGLALTIGSLLLFIFAYLVSGI